MSPARVPMEASGHCGRGRLEVGSIRANRLNLEDSPAVGGVDNKIHDAVLKRFARFWQTAEFAKHESANRFVLLPGKIQVEEFIDIIDAQASIQNVRVFAEGLHQRLLDIV